MPGSTDSAERTWKQRLQILAELCFVNLKEGPSGPASYALLLNPYRVIKWHFEMKMPGLRSDKYHVLLERAIDIGDESMSPPEPPLAVAPVVEEPAVAPQVAAPAPKAFQFELPKSLTVT